jgi:hypothetical protein
MTLYEREYATSREWLAYLQGKSDATWEVYEFFTSQESGEELFATILGHILIKEHEYAAAARELAEVVSYNEPFGLNEGSGFQQENKR